MKDIGSYIELEFAKGMELFKDVPSSNILRLNTCRAAICHAVHCYGVKKVWIAKYQCDVVRDFLLNDGLEVYYYDINEEFNPLLDNNDENTAIVLTNYFGILGDRHFDPLISKYHNVIIDNAQALFYHPKNNCINCYSPRKFVGSPDGAYVIGKNVNKFDYEIDSSSNSAQFLLMRYEYGCNGNGYKNKKENDDRINNSKIKLMSPLTYAILDSIDYDEIKEKRKKNYNYARSILDISNKLDLEKISDPDCAPMGYPYWQDFEIIPTFHKYHVYQARYWEHILDEYTENDIEYKFAKYLALLCIDQRYGKEEIDYQINIINDIKNKKG